MQTTSTRHGSTASNQTNSSNCSLSTLVELLGDEYVRECLAAIRSEPKAARTIAEERDISRSTVYRRLERLQDAGLVRTEMTYDERGHHRRVFDAVVEGVELELDGDGFSVRVSTFDSDSSRSESGRDAVTEPVGSPSKY
ncbi:winged helix-turn-helix domain-containing protein [Halogeometricum rufum]|nr:winged helix-turn-helix domain-containing protein [Halogeometricum rufum]